MIQKAFLLLLGTFLVSFFFIVFFYNFGVGIMTKLLSPFSFLILVVSVTSNAQVSTSSAPCQIQTRLVDSDELPYKCGCFDEFYVYKTSRLVTEEISGLKNCQGRKATIFLLFS